MTDIVERLRASVTKGHEPTDADAIEAADEIERLRSLLAWHDSTVPEILADQTQHWAVSVEVNGENVLTIESNCLSGIESIADHEESVVTAAHHLLAFIGRCRPDAHHVREAAFQQWWKLSAHNGTLPPTRESLAREAYFAAWGGGPAVGMDVTSNG